MKQKKEELGGLYRNYLMLKKVIEGSAFLSDDGILIESEAPVWDAAKKEDTVWLEKTGSLK